MIERKKVFLFSLLIFYCSRATGRVSKIKNFTSSIPSISKQTFMSGESLLLLSRDTQHLYASAKQSDILLPEVSIGIKKPNFLWFFLNRSFLVDNYFQKQVQLQSLACLTGFITSIVVYFCRYCIQYLEKRFRSSSSVFSPILGGVIVSLLLFLGNNKLKSPFLLFPENINKYSFEKSRNEMQTYFNQCLRLVTIIIGIASGFSLGIVIFSSKSVI
jgi:hypothetical protein